MAFTETGVFQEASITMVEAGNWRTKTRGEDCWLLQGLIGIDSWIVIKSNQEASEESQL